MSEIVQIVILTSAAGLCMPLGGLLASLEHIRPKWLENELRHFIIAFGGGLLLGAVFQVLLPQGVSMVGESPVAVLVFMFGGFLFFLLDRSLGLKHREAPQLTGMLVDFVPESIALGGLVATEPSLAMVLAIVIGLQNAPEGFNAYRELIKSQSQQSAKVLWFMLLLVPLGPIAGLSAHYGLGDQPRTLGVIMLIAAGGIVYLMFQDIAPQSKLKRHWAPPLGAVLGVGITLLTELWIAGA
ncbi:divalent cation transporter [Seongchinamella sediminis]|uniref:Divalent cation transporter n=1 Tax=Seongchinamella sediminis TaxID=2283635 RepID=A0A3L7DTF6_9GAMM|nr:divalent cation transporter [Seongchinamella sediminis]RLQ20848.1 divalent cation transporter [Seongchinamella sediminis]